MPHCIFDRSTGQFVGGAIHDILPHDLATHISIDLPNYPDRRGDRWDGATGIRPATAQELAAYDAAKAEGASNRDIDGQKIVKALAIWTAQKLGVAPATMRAEVIAIYKSLN